MNTNKDFHYPPAEQLDTIWKMVEEGNEHSDEFFLTLGQRLDPVLSVYDCGDWVDCATDTHNPMVIARTVFWTNGNPDLIDDFYYASSYYRHTEEDLSSDSQEVKSFLKSTYRTARQEYDLWKQRQNDSSISEAICPLFVEWQKLLPQMLGRTEVETLSNVIAATNKLLLSMQRR